MERTSREQPTLRGYQQAGIDSTNRLIANGVRRVLLVLPTGGGKTIVAAAIVVRAYLEGQRVIFFAHRRELIHQTRRKLIAAGIPESAVGVLMGDDPLRRDGAPIQVASVDTWRHREPPPADVVFIDEAHRSLSATYLNVVEHYSGAVVMGLSATPFRADGGGLGKVYEELVTIATPSQLIADGHLVEPRVFAAKMKPDLEGVRVRAGEYAENDLAQAMLRGALIGNIVEHWQRHSNGIRTVAFAVNVAHSQAIVAAFSAAGISAEHLDGETPTKERDAILARLECGETLVVGNCNVLSEGWDQPCVKCAILARPTMSPGLYLQQAGRILRPYQGERAIILDHAGNALAHGLPQDDREFRLDDGQKKAGRTKATTKECPECGAVLACAVQVCGECGHTYEREAPPPVDGEGELHEIDLRERALQIERWDALVEQWRAVNVQRIARGLRAHKAGALYYRWRERYGGEPPPGCKRPIEMATTEEKWDAYLELVETAKERGYKLGWAGYRYEERFGERVPGEWRVGP